MHEANKDFFRRKNACVTTLSTLASLFVRHARRISFCQIRLCAPSECTCWHVFDFHVTATLHGGPSASPPRCKEHSKLRIPHDSYPGAMFWSQTCTLEAYIYTNKNQHRKRMDGNLLRSCLVEQIFWQKKIWQRAKWIRMNYPSLPQFQLFVWLNHTFAFDEKCCQSRRFKGHT